MIASKLILVLVLRFLVTGVLALFVLTALVAFLVPGTEGVTIWQVIGLYLAAVLSSRRSATLRKASTELSTSIYRKEITLPVLHRQPQMQAAGMLQVKRELL